MGRAHYGVWFLCLWIIGEEIVVAEDLDRRDAERRDGRARGLCCRTGEAELCVTGPSLGEAFLKLIIPWAVAFILKWISTRLEEGGRLEEVRPFVDGEEEGPIIWTDAKATDTQAWIGGFLQTSDDPKACSWFSLEVKETIAPWLKCRGGSPKRVIAALEMLATVVAVKIWSPTFKKKAIARITAKTDNQGNGFALRKFMTSKYPGTVLLMEMAEELRSHDLGLDLQWVRRDDNQLADDLTNLEFGRFSEEKRVEMSEESITWRVFDRLDRESKLLYEAIQMLKAKSKQLSPDGKSPRPLRGRKRKILSKW